MDQSTMVVASGDGVKRRQAKFSPACAATAGGVKQILASGAATLLRKVAVQALPSSKCCQQRRVRAASSPAVRQCTPAARAHLLRIRDSASRRFDVLLCLRLQSIALRPKRDGRQAPTPPPSKLLGERKTIQVTLEDVRPRLIPSATPSLSRAPSSRPCPRSYQGPLASPRSTPPD